MCVDWLGGHGPSVVNSENLHVLDAAAAAAKYLVVKSRGVVQDEHGVGMEIDVAMGCASGGATAVGFETAVTLGQ